MIVARAFPPARPTWKHASKPFDPEHSSHGTHVAGIAAGNANTPAEGARISGVAPRAYLGNYKALTIPTDADVGLDGNSPELVAAIEAAVADGMDVINMSLGEPEIEPSRDIVVRALEAAARAGVVPVVSAGNDFAEFGRGSVGSPAATPSAITVGAVTTTRGGPDDVIASFSSSRPTPLSLQLKPDVSAPGAGILSAAPRSSWATLSGTSMAAPHVAGAVALLLQRHPTWTPAQVKSALALTGDPAYSSGAKSEETPTLRGGGGVVNLPRADAVPLFARPVAFAFGVLRSNAASSARCRLTDSGLGGSGQWTVTVEPQSAGSAVSAPAAVTVPGRLDVTARTTQATDGEATGYVVLTRSRAAPDSVLVRHRQPCPRKRKARGPAAAGQLQVLDEGRCDARRALSLSRQPGGTGLQRDLAGPERVFRVTLTRPATNFGVVVTSRAPGVRVEPRIVRAGDERRLTGYPALPFNLNPYLRTFGEPVLASGTILPAAGAYDIVFDSPSAARAGAFTFRYWLNDATPPTASLRTKSVPGGSPILVHAGDTGSGIDPASFFVTIDGDEHAGQWSRACSDRHVRPASGQPRAAGAGLRLPGIAEHGERRPDPAEHSRARDQLRRPLAPSVLFLDRRQFRQVALDALRELLLFRADHLEARLAAPALALPAGVRPTNLPKRGHSAAITTAAARTSSTIHGQLTSAVYPRRLQS